MNNNETTIYDSDVRKSSADSEQTIYDDKSPNTQAQQVQKPIKKKRNAGKWTAPVAGAAAGFVLGGTTAKAEEHITGNIATENDTQTETEEETASTVEWSDGQILIATDVDDNMSFAEAFQAAREEVGPGGAFEWHGNVYSTYLAEEWKEMDAEQRAEFNNHFSWNSHHSSHTDNNTYDTSDSVEVEVLGVEDGDETEDIIPLSDESVVIDVEIDEEPPMEEVIGEEEGYQQEETGDYLSSNEMDGSSVDLDLNY